MKTWYMHFSQMQLPVSWLPCLFRFVEVLLKVMLTRSFLSNCFQWVCLI